MADAFRCSHNHFPFPAKCTTGLYVPLSCRQVYPCDSCGQTRWAEVMVPSSRIDPTMILHSLSFSHWPAGTADSAGDARAPGATRWKVPGSLNHHLEGCLLNVHIVLLHEGEINFYCVNPLRSGDSLF